MRFILYTDKTVAQCMSAINERLHVKATKARSELGGWTNKDGNFSLTVTSRVVGRFPRTTRLTANAKRDTGMTVIRGDVSDGVTPQWLGILMIGVGIIIALMVIVGELMLALLMLLFAMFAYIPLRGDYVNSDVLLLEVEKTLKASPKPPKKNTRESD